MKHRHYKDTVTIKYMKQSKVFADAFNFFIYGGEQRIKAEELTELDTREIDVPYGGEEGAEQPVQRTRDVIKSVAAMADRRAAYLILAIENQSHIHYAMPVRNMVYDALQYAKQVERAIASHRASGDYRGISSDEYLSGFMKDDHLLPVVTLVIYFGAEPWDGPLSIHEMFEYEDGRVLAYVPDYKINLIAPAQIADADFDKFKTTLREVLEFIKYSEDADKLQQILAKEEGFHHLGRPEVNVLNACTGVSLPVREKEEVLDVCKAIRVLEQRAADKAADNMKVTTRLENIRSLMEKIGWTAEESMDALAIPEGDREVLMALL